MSIGSLLRRRSLWLTLLAALLFGVLAYQFRSVYVIPVGSWYDRVAIRNGWWGDELADNQRYRWTSSNAEVELTNFGPLVSGDYSLSIQAQFYTNTITSRAMTITLGSKAFHPRTIDLSLHAYYFAVSNADLQAAGNPPHLTISVPTFTVPGDSRNLGVRVTSIIVGTKFDNGFALTIPPLAPLIYLVLIALLLYLTTIRQRIIGATFAALIFIMIAFLLIFYRPLTVWLLPAFAVIALALTLIVWRRKLFGWYPPLLARLRSLPEDAVSQRIVKTDKRIGPADSSSVEGAKSLSPLGIGLVRGESRPANEIEGSNEAKSLSPLGIGLVRGESRPASMLKEAHKPPFTIYHSPFTIALIAALIIYVVFALWLVATVDFIGHADYADNAVVARNIAHGLGATTDYVAQFYSQYPSVQHPADTWPLLQPLITVPFLLISDTTFAAKLPNLILMLALAWSVFYVGRRIWDARVALLAAVLVLVSPAFLSMVVYPINDLAFTLLFLWLLYIVVTRRLSDAASWRAWVAWGILAGLLIWSKPSGATLLVALFGYALWVVWKQPLTPTLPPEVGGGTAPTPTLPPEGGGGTAPTPTLPPEGGGGTAPTPTLPPDGGGEIVRHTLISSLIVVVIALAVISPLLIRNITSFGSPFYSTESYDAWVLKWNPPFERIYAYWSPSDLPNRSWLLRYGYDAIYRGIGREVQALWAGNSPTGGGSGLLGGDIGRPLAVVLAIIALFVAPRGWRHIRGNVRQGEQRFAPADGTLAQGEQRFAPTDGTLEQGEQRFAPTDGSLAQGEQRFAPTDGSLAQGEQRFAPTESVAMPLMLSLIIYAAFITLYWHYEPRYFYAYIPWVYLLAAAALFWLYDAIPKLLQPARVRIGVVGATLFVILYAGFLLYTSVSQLVTDSGNYAGATPLVAAAQWFEANTPPGTVAMSRNPWEFSWHSDRLGVMIPLDPQDINRSLPQIKAAAQQYHASYLMLDHLGGQGANYFRSDWRKDIAPMYNQRTACAGFSLVYQNQSVVIYKMDANKIGASCQP